MILALVGGGVFGVSMFAPDLLPNPVREILGHDMEKIRAEQEAAAALAATQRPAITALVDLEPITVPLFKDGDIDRFLVMHILVEVRPEDQPYVARNIVRLIDAFIAYTHALATLEIKPGIDDRDFLKSRLMAKSTEILGEGIVVDLLFQNIFERPLKG